MEFITLIEYYNLNETHGFDKIREDEVRDINYLYTKFKKQHNLIDFEDMLHKALDKDIIFPYYEILMVDEVQDLSKLEWAVIEKLAKKSKLSQKAKVSLKRCTISSRFRKYIICQHLLHK